MSFVSQVRRAILIGGLATSALVFILAVSQDKLIYLKRSYETHGLRQYYHKAKGVFEDKTQRVLLEVSYKTSFGDQTAFWVPPKGDVIRSQTFERLWIVFGGNAQLALDWLWALERLAPSFQKDSFLLMDYPGYGRCQGNTQGSTTTMESVHIAAEKVVEMLYENRTTERPNVGILAHSIGCAAGLHYAASSKYPVSHMVLISPFASIPRMAAHLFFPSTIEHSPIVSTITESLVAPRNRWDNFRAIDEIGQQLRKKQDWMQVVIIHGDDDEVCPYKQGLEVYAKLQEYQPFVKSKFVRIYGGDHNGIIEVGLDQIQQAMRAKL